jgi:DMSO/TMAO reductase YedYZ molybdopterin-dependent catalytic subunit
MSGAHQGGDRHVHVACGVLAAGLAMAVGHLVAGLIDPAVSPTLVVGSGIVDAAPRTVKVLATTTLGTADKPVLLVGVTVVTLVVAGGLGAWARSRRGPAVLAMAVLGLVPVVMVLATHPGGPSPLVPALAGAASGTFALARLATLADGAARPAAYDRIASGAPALAARRDVLVGLGVTGAATLTSAALGQWLGRPVAAARAVVLPRPRSALPPPPEGLERSLPEVTPLRTPVASFYRVDTALTIPRVDVDTWHLVVDGMVDREVSIGFADLLDLGLVERDITLNCVSNEVGGRYIGSTRWSGVPVRLLLDRAGVDPGADQVLSTSVDGMTISTPVEALMASGEREALLAVGMEGRPLPPQHGFPVRLVTPGLYGYVGATKWVSRLTLTTFESTKAYWSTRGWAERAEVKVQTRIDTPTGRTGLGAAPVAIAGVAWAQAGGGVTAVQIRVDDGPWQQATLGPDLGPVYWRQWWLRWTPTPGRHVLTARAVDGAGAVQTEKVADPAPSGATGWHSVTVSV